MPRDFKWEPPPVDFFKLNMDGAVFFDFQKVGVDFIIQDHGGKTLLADSITKSNVANS